MASIVKSYCSRCAIQLGSTLSDALPLLSQVDNRFWGVAQRATTSRVTSYHEHPQALIVHLPPRTNRATHLWPVQCCNLGTIRRLFHPRERESCTQFLMYVLQECQVLSDRNEKTLAGNAVRRGKAAGIGRALGVEAILSRHLEIRLGFDCVLWLSVIRGGRHLLPRVGMMRTTLLLEHCLPVKTGLLVRV